MAVATNRVFRVERANMDPEAKISVVSDDNTQVRHDEIMSALGDIRENIPSHDSAPQQEGVSRQVIESCQRDLREAQKIKDELKDIHYAISRTKQEIATLHRGEVQGVDVARMSNELDAIVEGTEQATQAILQSAENIDNKAGDLVAALTDDVQKDAASDIQDQVIQIFEACNFQDLTGQRISKVVKAFCFIEERVHRMMEIWGGLESFKDVELDPSCTRNDDEALLNGPSLEDDDNIASQDEIDALFD